MFNLQIPGELSTNSKSGSMDRIGGNQHLLVDGENQKIGKLKSGEILGGGFKDFFKPLAREMISNIDQYFQIG